MTVERRVDAVEAGLACSLGLPDGVMSREASRIAG